MALIFVALYAFAQYYTTRLTSQMRPARGAFKNNNFVMCIITRLNLSGVLRDFSKERRLVVNGI